MPVTFELSGSTALKTSFYNGCYYMALEHFGKPMSVNTKFVPASTRGNDNSTTQRERQTSVKSRNAANFSGPKVI